MLNAMKLTLFRGILGNPKIAVDLRVRGPAATTHGKSSYSTVIVPVGVIIDQRLTRSPRRHLSPPTSNKYCHSGS